MTYEEALKYLEHLGKFGINLGLKRIEQLLSLMKNPERRFKTIHIAGTNGKGSTTAMLASVLQAAGIRTGMYISPHLIEYTERIVVDGRPVSRRQFAGAVEYVKQWADYMTAHGGEHPTQFEVLTAAAFYHFSLAEVEYAVIEVGLGGLLDSTNVIIPELSVITNVTLDHTDRCGSTIAEIAGHKAGVIKSGVPVVTGAQDEALAVIAAKAAEKSAPLYVRGRDFTGRSAGIEAFRQKVAVTIGECAPACDYEMGLLGRHQADNCALAVMAASILGRSDGRITGSAVRGGLAEVSWPGRFEIFAGEPVIVIDGAHNPAGAKVLRNTLDELFPGKNIVFLLGILKDKDIAGIVTALIRPADSVVVAAPLSDRAGDTQDIAREITAQHVETAATIRQGFGRAISLGRSLDNVVCAAGSLYLIGTVRQFVVGRQKSGRWI
jgi:dihydrofolate synthase/folylpolyglutamate synthase